MSDTPDYYKYPMVQTYMSLARSYRMQGKIVDAFKRYERALEVCYMTNADSLVDDIRQSMIDLTLDKNSPEDVRLRQNEIRRIIILKDDLKNERFDVAQKELNTLINAGCKDPELYILRGDLALKKNKKGEAAYYLFSAAQYCYDIRAITKAETYCAQVLRFNADHLEARILLTEIHRRQGVTNQASIEMLNVVREYLKRNQLKEAFTYVQKAVDIGNMEAHYIQGLMLFHEGKLDPAKKKFEIVNNMNERHAGALSYLARIYQKQNLIDNAQETYEKLVAIKPKDPEAHFKLADMLLKSGLIKKALEHYQQAAQLYSDTGDPEKAEGAARMANQLWESLQEGDRGEPEPLGKPEENSVPEQVKEKSDGIPAPTPTGDETVFEPVVADKHYTASELLMFYKTASDSDTRNTALREAFHALELEVMWNKSEAFSETTLFMPVSNLEMLLVSEDSKQHMHEQFNQLSHVHAGDAKLRALVESLAVKEE